MSDYYQSLFQNAVSALAAIDDALGLPQDGCKSTARTLAEIKKLRSSHGQAQALARTVMLDQVYHENCASADAIVAGHAKRLALELECLLLSCNDTAAVSKWWDSAHEALEQYRADIDRLYPPPPTHMGEPVLPKGDV
jgi:hypothetical protein